MSTYTDALAATMRAESAARGWAVQRLADESHVAYGTLRRYIEGKRPIPSDVIALVAAAFGLTPSQLLLLTEQRLDATR